MFSVIDLEEAARSSSRPIAAAEAVLPVPSAGEVGISMA